MSAEQLPDPGVPALLRHLSALLGETTILVYSPPPAGDGARWRVWAGSPYATAHQSGGGEWGAGSTPYAALQAAFERAVRSTFDGHVGVEPARDKYAADKLFEAAREAVDAHGRGDDERRTAGAYRLLDSAVRLYASTTEA